ncbi:hypothetical protein ACQKWADRAFT_88837 [Trichoderma austrokoningii]
MHAVALGPLGALAAPAIALHALCTSTARCPIHLSSHTKARLHGRLTDPSLSHPRLSVRHSLHCGHFDPSIVAGLGFEPRSSSGIPPSKLSADEALCISQPTHTHTHANLQLLYQRRFAELFAVLFSASTCSSGIRNAASIKRELQNLFLLAATPYCIHDRRHSSINDENQLLLPSWCMCSPSLHILSRGVLTPGPSARPDVS